MKRLFSVTVATAEAAWGNDRAADWGADYLRDDDVITAECDEQGRTFVYATRPGEPERFDLGFMAEQLTPEDIAAVA